MGEDSADQPEKKIFVDEDWKSQVEREREALRKDQEKENDSDAVADSAAGTSGAESTAEGQLPPASFEQLVSMLASSAMVFLGEIPDPVEKKPVQRLPEARHYIDLLEVLSEKTQGNLSQQESAMLQTVVYQLRMAFVAANERT